VPHFFIVDKCARRLSEIFMKPTFVTNPVLSEQIKNLVIRSPSALENCRRDKTNARSTSCHWCYTVSAFCRFRADIAMRGISKAVFLSWYFLLQARKEACTPFQVPSQRGDRICIFIGRLSLYYTNSLFSTSDVDVALYLLKRHSGIVWGPGRFARRGREEIGEPCGRTRPRPHALAYLGLPN
jgi:hypothetical protein